MLENHHCAEAFKILTKDSSNIFANMDSEEFKIFRKYVIHGIIHTDMALHFSMVKSITSQWEKNDFNPDEELNSNDFVDFFGLIMHTSDLYAPSKEFEISKNWADMVNQEFTNQYKKEQDLGIPQTSFFKDLDNRIVMAKSETFFVGKIVLPLWEITNQIMAGALNQEVEQCKKNLQNWKDVADGKLKID